jgi:hypothetical protein
MQRRPTPEERLQRTVPARPVRIPLRRQPAHPIPPAPRAYTTPPAPARHAGMRRRTLPPRPQPRTGPRWWLIAPLAGLLLMALVVCGVFTLGVGMIYARGILPGVSSAGVPLGGLSEREAAQTLAAHWNTITLRDGDRSWQFDPGELGILLDAEATARAAHSQGRSEGSALEAVLGTVEVAPRLSVDLAQAAAVLGQIAPQFALAPINAGVELVDGDVRATPSQDGRALSAEGLLQILQGDLAQTLADGVLELPMLRVVPAVTDASPMIAQARALLANPLRIIAYDPIANRTDEWRVQPNEWSRWLSAAPNPSSPTGLTLTLESAPLENYLTRQAQNLGGGRYVNSAEAVNALQAAIRSGITQASIRIYHRDRQHVVQPGETLITIAWDYGVPYPWIQQANPGLGEIIAAGQVITIPSQDNFLEFPPVPHKRIVVSLREQRTRVYENGQLKWDWPTSTGIRDSPTWPGVYQIILHDPNAYAANWNLHMPWFLGVYRPVPGTAFTNGFHGFPTRGGSQIIWTNSLGTRVTYGCILLSSENARQLYDWAEAGVVVEIIA